MVIANILGQLNLFCAMNYNDDVACWNHSADGSSKLKPTALRKAYSLLTSEPGPHYYKSSSRTRVCDTIILYQEDEAVMVPSSSR